MRWSRCPPPHNFTPAGLIHHAEIATQNPPFSIPTPRRGSRAAGARFERKVQGHLRGSRPLSYRSSPWIFFNHKRWCQPDGLDVDEEAHRITTVEFKLQHTSNAWHQTRRLYEPLVKFIFGEEYTYNILEIVKWLDPHVAFPERFEILDEPFLNMRNDAFHVCIWR